ncbi:hypothetical protein HYV12_03420 [Candidatus Dojkabacteria bacterium]|nr:hypothetical protein [Candidatus Dojkabacteria bacterium]
MYERKNPVSKIVSDLLGKKTGKVLGSLLNVFNRSYLVYLFNSLFKSSTKFVVGGDIYNYFVHRYNYTWLNERTVELPIFKAFLNARKGNILEVGNVYSHYYRNEYEILDKYEHGTNVVNEDIIDYSPGKKYDTIFSISTLEHVGLDEAIVEAGKVRKALLHMQSMLSPKGIIMFSFPVGYNPELDNMLFNENLFENVICLAKVPSTNNWKEVRVQEMKDFKFDRDTFTSNGVVIVKSTSTSI